MFISNLEHISMSKSNAYLQHHVEQDSVKLILSQSEFDNESSDNFSVLLFIYHSARMYLASTEVSINRTIRKAKPSETEEMP